MDTAEIVKTQRAYFYGGRTRSVKFRKAQLKRLLTEIKARGGEIADALHRDLGKNAFESYVSEIAMVTGEIKYMLRHIGSLARPKRVRTALLSFPGKSRIYREPYGVALVMSPWNYPLQLTLCPLVGAIAAGCCAVVKPSAYAPATSRVVAGLIRACFEERYVAVLEGGRQVNSELLAQKFDVIFFTGGGAVGKLVMSSAAENLTPVILELGGKSPCIVDETADLRQAAKRIVWGKAMNAGQTCVAPDYILAHRSVSDELTAELARAVEFLYGKTQTDNVNFPKIVNAKHFARVCSLIDDTLAEGGKLVCGGGRDEEAEKIDLTVLANVGFDSPVMREEIFGPVLPVLVYDDLDGAIAEINARPRPLALYLFTRSKAAEKRVLSLVPFGGGCVNDALLHLANHRLPFGGSGASGMGNYHGKASFYAFTHEKSVLKKRASFDLPFRYITRKNTAKLADRLLGRKK